MILGVHCDMRKGYAAALRRAEELGCEALQMLPYRRHHDPSDDELAGFREALAASPVKKLVVHVRYAPYLASTDAGKRRRSIAHLAREMRLARGLGGSCLVMHMGAYSPDSTAERGELLLADAVKAASDEAGDTVPLLAENVPGGGRRLGGSVEEIASFLEELDKRSVRAGACVDTAHAMAYGYEIDTRDGMWRFLARVHRLIGAENVPVFHLNDTRAQAGSHQENHACWGEGFIRAEGLKALLEREDYADAVGIIESPRFGGEEKSLAFVRKHL